MRMKFTVTMDVDVDRWAADYNMSKDYVPTDVEAWLHGLIYASRAIDDGWVTDVEVDGGAV